MTHTLMGWLNEHHNEITTELLMGVITDDPERNAAMRDPAEAEKWVRRHHRAAYEEWKHSEDGGRTKRRFFSRSGR